MLITENTFAGNGTYAAYLCCTRSISIFRNTISDYGGGIYLIGTMSANTRLGNNPGCPYVLNNLTVAEGATLTIEPGTVIKGDIQYGRLVINGALVAKGTEQAPIIFTSLRDDTCEGDTNNDGSKSSPAAGDWDGIFFYNTGNGSTRYNIRNDSTHYNTGNGLAHYNTGTGNGSARYNTGPAMVRPVITSAMIRHIITPAMVRPASWTIALSSMQDTATRAAVSLSIVPHLA